MTTSKPLFSFSQADIGYKDKLLITDFSWEVAYGEHWAIVGPNGAGKTTLVRTLLGFIPLLKGRLSFYDILGNIRLDIETVGYLPQINQIDKTFPINVAEVIASGLYGLGLSKIEERLQVKSWLEHIDLSEYEHWAIGKLSGGQLQRVLLARALASRPKLLLLDEPTSFLDKKYKEQFFLLLRQFVSPETTILMITHDLPDIERNSWQILPIGQW